MYPMPASSTAPTGSSLSRVGRCRCGIVPQGVGGIHLGGRPGALDVWDLGPSRVGSVPNEVTTWPAVSSHRGARVMTRLSRTSGPFLPYEHLLTWEAEGA